MLLAHDHSELDELLGELFRALTAGDVPQTFEKLDLFWARLAIHIRAEHLHLFPALLHALESLGQTKQLPSRVPSLQTAQNTIARLHEDHEFFMTELAAAIQELRQTTHQDKSSLLQNVRKKVIAVSERLKVHNEFEESDVYQWMDVLLAPPERVALNQKMQKELDNLPQRFCRAEK
jgi:hypothetical protein